MFWRAISCLFGIDQASSNTASSKNSCMKRESMQAYARTRSDRPELVDIVAVNAANEQQMDIDGKRAPKRQRIYEEHRPLSAITEGMKHGRLHQVCHSPNCLATAPM